MLKILAVILPMLPGLLLGSSCPMVTLFFLSHKCLAFTLWVTCLAPRGSTALGYRLWIPHWCFRGVSESRFIFYKKNVLLAPFSMKISAISSMHTLRGVPEFLGIFSNF